MTPTYTNDTPIIISMEEVQIPEFDEDDEDDVTIMETKIEEGTAKTPYEGTTNKINTLIDGFIKRAV